MKPETLERLRAYKLGGKSYDAVLNALMDETPPAAFLREHLRRLRKEPRASWGSVKSKMKS